MFIYQKKPFGVDPFSDLKNRFFQDYQFKTFFDVGANIGQTAHHIHDAFPNSDIWCFEPIKRTFEQLRNNTRNIAVKRFHLGLGSENKTLNILIDPDHRSDMNSLINPSETNNAKTANETIEIQKLDDFCLSQSVKTIDYLKIDTEGYDFEVLKGAQGLLQEQSISFVETEVSMNPENTFHVDFVDVKRYMESYGYRLFGLYDQFYEWQTGTPILRRTNPLFVSERVYKREFKG